MTPQELDHFLRTLSEHERMYQAGCENISCRAMDKIIDSNGDEVCVLNLHACPEAFPLLNGNKHSRFTAYPKHIHPWIEFNYMYSGSCIQRVNGIEVSLKKGQMLLLDQNTCHELPVLGEDDILLNIIIMKNYLTTGFFNRISQKNILSQFFIEAITEGLAHNRYLFFPSEHSRKLPLLIQEFFCEIYDPSDYAADTLNSLFSLISIELVKIYQAAATVRIPPEKSSALSILQYIGENYRTATLRDAASRFNLNPNYLSNLLKKQTGHSFKELVQQQRMNTARQLLSNSALPISEVAYRSGYENTTFFYKKFREATGVTPADYRHSSSAKV